MQSVIATTIATCAAIGLALPATAAAASAGILALPGSVSSTFTTKTVNVPRGGTVAFTNLDFAPHSVVATKLKKHRPVFSTSRAIQLGSTTPVDGVSGLKPGSYGFICSIHPYMHGTLIVR